MSAAGESGHAALMDGVYRHQRHIYDLTRKFYLLGRDRMIAALDPPPGGSVLEIGCGTGRNLVLAARRHPGCRLFGLDISAEMLASAQRAVVMERIADRVALAQADATRFDPQALFRQSRFDCVFISYSLSMIPGWEAAIARAVAVLAPGGALHVVDFGQQEGLPVWLRAGLRAWLRRFHVEPRAMLAAELAVQAEAIGGSMVFEPLHRGYAWRAILRSPMPPPPGAYSSSADSAATSA